MPQSHETNNSVTSQRLPIMLTLQDRTTIHQHLQSLAALPWDDSTRSALSLTSAFFHSVTTHDPRKTKRALKPSAKAGINRVTAQFQGVTTHGPRPTKRPRKSTKKSTAAAKK